jgi:hypothetical protein
LELAQLNLKPNESHETLWERLSAFIEDNLLKKSSGIKHLGAKIEHDEVLSATLQNVTVVLWLRAINSDLPLMIKQRFATQLRNTTLYSLRDDISESLPSVLAEMQEREFTVSLARGFQQKRSGNKSSSRSSRFQSQFSSRSSPQRQKSCCLCEAAGRPGANNHFLSECRHLPSDDKRYISRVRDVMNDSDEEVTDNEVKACVISTTPTTNRVDVLPSPILEVDIEGNSACVTMDSGSEINLIEEGECKRLNLKIVATPQKACMADGRTKIPVKGEVSFKGIKECEENLHIMRFNGLVVEKLSCPILAGQPFLYLNDVHTRAAKQMVYIGDCCENKSLKKSATSTVRLCKASILRASQKTCLLPGDKVTLQIAEEFRNQPVAVEPRCIAASSVSVPAWLQCQIVNSNIDGEIELINSSAEPVLIKKHEQFAQIRHIETDQRSTTQIIAPVIKPTEISGPFSTSIEVDPAEVLSQNQREEFRSIHQELDSVFAPELGKYNGASGSFQHVINMGSSLPPQRKGRNPMYNRNNMEALQDKMDELLAKGVLAKPEDIDVNVEYVSPSFLVKKSNGGHRLVTG